VSYQTSKNITLSEPWTTEYLQNLLLFVAVHVL